MKTIGNLLLITLLGFGALAWSETPYELALTAAAKGNWNAVEQQLAGPQETEGLLLRGEARRALGYLDWANADHETAWHQVEMQPGTLHIWAARASAETLLAQRHYAEAEKRLNTGLESTADIGEQACLLLIKGRLESAQGNNEAAQNAYTKARNAADQAQLPSIGIQARLGLTDSGSMPALKDLEDLAIRIDTVTPNYARVTLWLALAERACQCYPQMQNNPQSTNLNLAQALIKLAAPAVTEGRQRAEFLSLQAALLEATGHFREALIPAAEAVIVAQNIVAADLLLQEEWRRGRLYRALNDRGRALDAWRRAIFHLQAVRPDMPIEYHAGRSSFRETLSPLYLGLADLLLQQTAKLSEDAAQPLLLEARDTIENLKAAELQDYLGDACPLEMHPIANLEAIAPRTGVLYPILLPDRLELLLGIGNRQHRASVAIQADKVRQTAEKLAERLRQPTMSDPASVSKQLFNWIIAPVRNWLDAGQVDTLVIVPDGPLRLFPFGALMNDQKQFLVERYAVVTAPSLTLIDPQPLARTGLQALVAGMSYPGPVIDELPDSLLGNLLESTGAARGFAVARGWNLGSSRGHQGNIPDKREVRAALQKTEVRKSIADLLALPGVEPEIQSIAATLNSEPLLNQNFTLHDFGAAMKHPLSVVHVASHGVFGGTPDTSFFMTYDHLLKMDQLEFLVQGEQRQPPELLTLSACQTAEGNDRAPLGLTGVAVKSGARSAIGSLWPVSDEATQLLLSDFYRRLLNPTLTKAQAFRGAQLTVLHDERFHHPYFWSPFILIGNWL